jgi:hypothetical protein
MKRSLYATFMNVGTSEKPDYARMGKGISEMKEAYNAEEESNQYIHEDSATNEVISYSPTFDVTQKCYVGEKIFEFVDEKRKNLAVEEDAKTDCLKVYLYSQLAENVFEAAKINTTLVIGDFDAKEITYNVKQNGNQETGYVTISENGEVTFTKGKYTA